MNILSVSHLNQNIFLYKNLLNFSQEIHWRHEQDVYKLIFFPIEIFFSYLENQHSKSWLLPVVEHWLLALIEDEYIWYKTSYKGLNLIGHKFESPSEDRTSYSVIIICETSLLTITPQRNAYKSRMWWNNVLIPFLFDLVGRSCENSVELN